MLLPFERLGLATVAHLGLNLIPQRLGNGWFVVALVEFTIEHESAIVEGVSEHLLDLGAGQGISSLVYQTKTPQLLAKLRERD